MPVGWQIWNSSGDIIVDTSMRLGRILGVLTLTGGTDGSASNAGLATGSPFWLLTCVAGGNYTQPTISVSGTTISWAFPAFSSVVGWRLVYGVY